ncbi:MAG: ATP-binding protein [Thermoguttaceae bacterium]|jgi:PAS domain S-box-containing protein
MTEKQLHPDDFADLRRRAEKKARDEETQTRETLPPQEAGRLLHDLQVHQIELEMQNEELRRAQGELEASRARYFDLFDLAPVGYFTLNEQGLILEANLTGAGLLGVGRNALVKQPLTRFILPDDQDIYYRHRKQLFETGTPQVYELQVLRADAAPFWAQLETIEAQDAGGAPVCRAVMSDVTARKQAEEKLAELDRRKDQFLAMLSHELRNPLAPILNAVQLLQLQKAKNSVEQKALAIIERQVGQLTHLVSDLMEVSRAIAGRIELCQERVTVGGIVERAVETARPLIDQRRHELTVSLPPDPIWLYADASRLEQVVTNLLTNAAKYTNEGGHIWLSAQQEDDKAVLRVRDTGLGIAPAFLPHVFDLFTQAQRSSDRSQGGLGIGLTLAQRLVEMHGGSIGVSSTLGQGSEFVVRLLVCPPGTMPPETQPPQTENARPTGPALRVLVVDDNVDAANVLKMLVQEAGHLVRMAHTGPTALAAALDDRPDVMLLDIGLPELDGFEVAKRIRQEPLLHKIVLVAVTGYRQAADRQRVLEAGFDHYLVKPADFDMVRHILAAVAEKK